MGRQAISPNDYDEQRLAGLTDFRCEICNDRWPYDMLDEPTYAAIGRRVCKANCNYDPPHNQGDIIEAREIVELTKLTADNVAESAQRLGRAPVGASLVASVPVIESITSPSGTYPVPVDLTVGGASVVVTLNGLNHSSDDEISYSSAVTDASAVSRTETATTLTVQSTEGPAGYYDLTFNGNVYRNVFRVRG